MKTDENKKSKHQIRVMWCKIFGLPLSVLKDIDNFGVVKLNPYKLEREDILKTDYPKPKRKKKR